MTSVLCIAGLDPSGHAGLSADIRALEYLGIKALPIASVLTVQNSKSFSEFQPVSLDIIKKQLHAVLEDERPKAAKIGMLGTAEAAKDIAGILSENNISMIVDPVLGSSTGYFFVDEELMDTYKNFVFPKANLVTPNAHEASIITGIEVKDPETAKKACQRLMDWGPKAVLIKGGHFDIERGTDILYDGSEFHLYEAKYISRDLRGTGCTLSSLIAGYLTIGFQMTESIQQAKLDMNRFFENISGRDIEWAPRFLDWKGISSEEWSQVWTKLNIATSQLMSLLRPDMIAEVGNNIAYAFKNANSHEQVLSLNSRFILRANKVVTMGYPQIRKSHIARVVLAAMAHDPKMRCAMNLKYSDALIGQMEKSGFTIGSFSRAEQPEDSSSMEWGTGKAISDLGYVPDAVFDQGGVGKEPMIRLLAPNPEELLVKLRKVIGGMQ